MRPGLMVWTGALDRPGDSTKDMRRETAKVRFQLIHRASTNSFVV